MKQKNGKFLILSGVLLLVSSIVTPYGVNALSATNATAGSATASSATIASSATSTTTAKSTNKAVNTSGLDELRVNNEGYSYTEVSMNETTVNGNFNKDTEEEGKMCDFTNNGKVDVSDVTRFQNHCSITEGRDSNRCDLNGDKKFDVSDVNIFNNKCIGEEILGKDTEEEGKMCDFDKDNIITSEDIARFKQNCDLTSQRDLKKCDLNKDGIFSSVDIVIFNDDCYGELLGKTPVDCEDPAIQLVCIDPNLDVYVQCPEICRPDGMLVNDLTETVTFNTDETDKKVVFSGRYTAIKDNISINSIAFENISNIECDYNSTGENYGMEFYLTIDGRTINTSAGPSFIAGHCSENGLVRFDNNEEIFIKKGSSVSIKIEGKNRGNNQPGDLKLKTTLGYFDGNYFWEGYKRGEASAYLAPIRIVENKLSIQTPSKQDTVYLKSKNSTLAEFTLKPSKGNSAYLNELELEIDETRIENDDITLLIDNTEQELTSLKNHTFTYQPDMEISSKGVNVKLILNQELEYDDYTVGTKIKSINGKSINKSFSKRFVSVLVYIAKQENRGDHTKFTLGIEKYDDNYLITSICMLTGSTGAGTCLLGENYDDGPFENGFTFDVYNSSQIQPINYITYFIGNSERTSWADSISIKKENYPDYFKVNGTDRKVYSDGSLGTGVTIQNKPFSGLTAEMKDAYEYAYENGITTVSIDKARMYSPLTRIQMAKMLSNYAINVLGQEPNLSIGMPVFNDVTNKLNIQYDNAVTKAYQLGIMGQNMENFRPNDPVTRAELGAALSRLLYGDTYNVTNGKYYEKHLEALKRNGIMSITDNPSKIAKRGDVMTMLMRTAE